MRSLRHVPHRISIRIRAIARGTRRLLEETTDRTDWTRALESESKADKLFTRVLPLVPAHHLLPRSPPFAHFATPAIGDHNAERRSSRFIQSPAGGERADGASPLLLSLTSHHPRSRSLNLAWVKLYRPYSLTAAPRDRPVTSRRSRRAGATGVTRASSWPRRCC